MSKFNLSSAREACNHNSWSLGIARVGATLVGIAALSACAGGSKGGDDGNGPAGVGASGSGSNGGNRGTDGAGAASGLEPTGITEYYGEFMMPVERNDCSTLHRPHSTPMWGISTTGRYAGAFVPSRMNSAAFQSTLIVSWVGSADYTEGFSDTTEKNEARYGHLSTFEFTEADGFSKVSDFYFEGCTKDMGSVAVSPDGMVIGALCLAHQNSPIGDYQDSAPEPNPNQTEAQLAGQAEMYLLEWTGGKVTQTPDKVVRLSRVSGGWNYGHWDLSLSNDLSRYFVEEKATGGGHETELYYTVDRTTYELDNRDGNCGGGHTLSNRITKNTYADSWSTWCQIDSNLLMRWRPFPIENYVSTVDSTELGIAQGDKVNTVTLGKFTPPGSITSNAGFVANMISLGSRGWLATAVGPLDLFEGTTNDEERMARRPKQQIGFRRLPLTIEGFVKNEADYPWHWLDLDHVCAPTKGGDPWVGMVQIHNWGKGGEDSGRILLGYSPAIEHPGRTNEYHVVQVDEQGTFLHDPVVLDRGGWGWDSLGTTMPDSGCVVFPHTWLSDDSTSGPSEQYPRDDKDVTERSMYLKLTAVCPSGAVPPKSSGACTTTESKASLTSAEAPAYSATCSSPY